MAETPHAYIKKLFSQVYTPRWNSAVMLSQRDPCTEDYEALNVASVASHRHPTARKTMLDIINLDNATLVTIYTDCLFNSK